MDTTTLKTRAIFALSRNGLKIRKYSPEILLGVGVAGVIGTVVMAVLATRKLDETINAYKERMDIVEEIEDKIAESEGDAEYSPEDVTKLKAGVYIQTGLDFAKLYGPTLALGTASLAAILASHGIMSKRQASLVAAYNVLNEGIKMYRKRVVEELGADADNKFKLGLRDENRVTDEVGPDGKKTKIRTTVTVREPEYISQYAKFFDEASPYHRRNASDNLFFLNTVQNYMNDKLMMNGHVFLNEVYDALGIPRTRDGQIVGWVRPSVNDPSHKIDFGIYASANESANDFVNGYTDTVLLDFNVDGIIFDLLK